MEKNLKRNSMIQLYMYITESFALQLKLAEILIANQLYFNKTVLKII